MAQPKPKALNAYTRQHPRGLTRRENEMLLLIAQHGTRHQVARMTHVAPTTIATYLTNIYQKLNVSTAVQAVHLGHTEGWLIPPPTPEPQQPEDEPALTKRIKLLERELARQKAQRDADWQNIINLIKALQTPTPANPAPS